MSHEELAVTPMDVMIHRCKVHVVRRGGWSWGADPDSLVRQVVQTLPALIAARLAAMAEPGMDRDILEPVSINVRLTLAELSEVLGAASKSTTPKAQEGNGRRIAERLVATIDEALRPHLEIPGPAEPAGPLGPPSADQVIHDSGGACDALECWLLEAHRLGRLGAHLQAFSPGALEIWHERLWTSARGATPPVNIPVDPELLEIVQDVIGSMGPLDPSPLGWRLRRIITAVEVGVRKGLRSDDPRVWWAIDAGLPPPGRADMITPDRDAEFAQRNSAAVGPSEGPRPAPHSAPGAFDPSLRNAPPLPETHDAAAPSQPAAPGPVRTDAHEARRAPPTQSGAPAPIKVANRLSDVHIESGLPFLLLGPLGQAGYLDAIAASFEAAGRTGALAALAVALAYKVLPAPERGWRRQPNAMAAAAAFAGLPEPVPEPELVALARQSAELLSPADTVLTQSLLRGHEANEPLLLQDLSEEFGGGWLLLDVQGHFPIAWAGEFAPLVKVLDAIDPVYLLIPADSAAPEVLREIHQAGSRFLTDAPPARGEAWRSFHLGASRWWTNDGVTHPAALARLASRLDTAAELTSTLWATLAVGHPSVPLARESGIERSLALAAALGLGQVAWAIWGDREPTDPLMTLERFATLDARVRFRDDSVHVTLPLGRRSLDLAEHRLLDDVSNVPWLDQRRVTFGKG